MTNTKPTWEDEFNKEFVSNCGGEKFSLPCKITQCATHHAYTECIKDFIQKIEQEAYERGQRDNAELNMMIYGDAFIDKKYYKEV